MKDNRFIELVNLYIDRQITGEEMETLEAEMQSNPRRRAIYRQYCQMHRATSMVYESFRTEGAEQPADMLRTDAKIARFETKAGNRRKHWTYYATGLAAACVALAFARVTFTRNAATHPETVATVQPVKTTVAAVAQASVSTPAAEQPKAIPATHVNTLVAQQDYAAMLAAMRKEDQRAFASGQIQPGRTASLFEDGVFDSQNSDSTRIFRNKRPQTSQQVEFAAFQFQR
jgi:hypothetical protein